MAFTLGLLWSLTVPEQHVLPLFGGLAAIICPLPLMVGNREGWSSGRSFQIGVHHRAHRGVPDE